MPEFEFVLKQKQEYKTFGGKNNTEMNTVFTNANSSWRFPSSPKESNQSRKKTRVTAAQSQQKQEHSRIRGPTLCWLSLSRFLIIYDKDQGHTLCGVLGLSGIAKLS